MLNSLSIAPSPPAAAYRASTGHCSPLRSRAAAVGGLGDLLFTRLPVPTLVLSLATSVLDSNLAADKLLDEGRALRLDHAGQVWYRSRGRWMSVLGLSSRMAAHTRRVTSIDLPDGSWGTLVVERLTVGEDEICSVVVVEGGQNDANVLRARFGLTPREAEIARLCSDGKAAGVIADELLIGLSTVRTHVLNLFRKTGTQKQCQLVAALMGRPVAGC